MSGLDPRGGSWAEYRRLVLAALEALEGRVKTIEDGRSGDGALAESVRKDLSALKKVVFGNGDPDSTLEVRLARLEDFVENHPSLRKEPEAPGEKPKVDKKMLVVLVGAISGLIALASKLVDVIQNLLDK